MAASQQSISQSLASTTRKADELERAFAAFNQTSTLLESAYRELETRTAHLTRELAEARSERTRQLEEKNRLAARLESFFEVLPGGVVILDDEGHVQEHNPSAEQLLGHPLVGLSWDTVLNRVGARGQAAGELSLRDGRWVSVSTQALDAEPGRIVLLTDVTENRRLLTLVERNERLSAMGEMSARLAHQTRTPLATAILYASQLGKRELDRKSLDRFSDKLLNRLHHLERLVNDMLAFARDDTANTSQTEEFDVGELLHDVANTIQAAECYQGRVGLCPTPPMNLVGNRQALHGALLNLINNALETGDPTAQVTLEAASDQNGQISLLVHDNGPGVADALREKIFEPFFTTRASGTGLGLAVVQSVARAHSGYASCANRPYRGATFGLHLPRRIEHALRSDANQTSHLRKRPKPRLVKLERVQ